MQLLTFSLGIYPDLHGVQLMPSPIAPVRHLSHHILFRSYLQLCPAWHMPAVHLAVLLAYVYTAPVAGRTMLV